jgi:prepilin-type N-terminal cleavage/methylation domain-containing protein
MHVRRLTRGHLRRGFTLPEILIVIVMISLLALLAIPRFATANGKRHMESARMRIAAAIATARAAAIQKGEIVTFKIENDSVTVKAGSDATDLVSPVPIKTLYSVSTNGSDYTISFTSRGFATLGAKTVINLTRPGVPGDSVVIRKTGMVQR